MAMQRGDPKLRRVVLTSVMGIAVVGIVLLLVLQHWLSELRALPLAAAQGKLSVAFALASGCLCATVTWIAALYWRWGTSVRRTARFPPPGMRVLRDTPVLLGDAALRRGRLMQVVGAILMLCAAGFAAAGWGFHHALAQTAV